MKHLPNCRDLTFQKNCDGPSVVVGHVVEEPATSGSGTVKLKIKKKVVTWCNILEVSDTVVFNRGVLEPLGAVKSYRGAANLTSIYW